MPPITFIAAEAMDVTLAAPVPVRARAGDLLLAIVLTTDTADLTLPEGWEELTRVSAPVNAGAAVWLLRHLVEDAEPASHTFVASAGDAWGVTLLYRGMAEVTGVINGQANDNASATSHAAPSVVATTYSDLLICVWAAWSTLAWTAPGDMTQRFNAESPDAGVDARIVIADRLPEATGATGTETAALAAPGAAAIACSLLVAATPPVQAVAIERPTPGGIGILEV